MAANFLLILSLVTAAAATKLSDELPAAAEEPSTTTTTHLHFYMHDTVTFPNATAITILNGTSAGNFGETNVIDDPLTEAPELSSGLVGRAQGFYTVATLETDEIALLLAVNLVFAAGGEYGGSTLAVIGRDAILAPVRELAVVGGSGAFRMARGYVLVTTQTFNATSGDAVLDLNVYVHVEPKI